MSELCPPAQPRLPRYSQTALRLSDALREESAE